MTIKLHDLLHTCTEYRWPLGRYITLPSSLLLSAGQQPLPFLLLSLWPVLVGQLEQLCGWEDKVYYSLHSPQHLQLISFFRLNWQEAVASVILVGKVSRAVQIANIHSHHLQSYKPTMLRIQSLFYEAKNIHKLLTGLTVQSLGELVDCRGNLQALVQDRALPLETNVTRPFHKAC